MWEMRLKKGSYLILEDSGSSLDEFYIVETGQLVVDTKEPYLEQMVDTEDLYFAFQSEEQTLTSGSFFGLMSPVLGYKRFESVWAKEDSKILCVNKRDMQRFIQKYKEYAGYILSDLFERLKNYNRFFTNRSNSSHPAQVLYEIAHHFYQRDKIPQAFYAYETLISEYPENPYTKKAIEKIAQEKQKKRYLDVSDFVENQPTRYQKNNMTFYQYQAGQIICCEAETGNELFLIKSGEVLITKINSEGSSLLDILGEGELFGEMAVLNNKKTNTPDCSLNKRSATAIAKTDITLVGISREKIMSIFELENCHIFVEKLLKTLLKRIWHTKLMLLSRTLTDPLDKITAVLYSEIFKKTNPDDFVEGTGSKHLFEFDFGLSGLLERIDPEKTIHTTPTLAYRFNLNDFLEGCSLKTRHGASIMKSKKMFLLVNHHIACDDPLEIIHAWGKIKKKVF